MSLSTITRTAAALGCLVAAAAAFAETPAPQGVVRLTSNASVEVTRDVLSIAFGMFLVYDLGVVKGLFGASPQWTPQ